MTVFNQSVSFQPLKFVYNIGSCLWKLKNLIYYFMVLTMPSQYRDRTYLERECLVGLALAVSEKILARLYITIGLVAGY